MAKIMVTPSKTFSYKGRKIYPIHEPMLDAFGLEVHWRVRGELHRRKFIVDGTVLAARKNPKKDLYHEVTRWIDADIESTKPQFYYKYNTV